MSTSALMTEFNINNASKNINEVKAVAYLYNRGAYGFAGVSCLIFNLNYLHLHKFKVSGSIVATFLLLHFYFTIKRVFNF